VTKRSGKGSRIARVAERFAKVNEVRLHYLSGGKGSPVVLLHGYAETFDRWRSIVPLLARRHTVIVPHLRGAGASAKPESGYTKKDIAVDIHELTSSTLYALIVCASAATTSDRWWPTPPPLSFPPAIPSVWC